MTAYTGNEKRAYQRDTEYDGTAKVSKDQSEWYEVKIADLSASGMKFYHKGGIFAPGEMLYFKFNVTPLAPKNIIPPKVIAQAKLLRANNCEHGFEYGVVFTNLSKEAQICVDELIAHKNRYYESKDDDN